MGSCVWCFCVACTGSVPLLRRGGELLMLRTVWNCSLPAVLCDPCVAVQASTTTASAFVCVSCMVRSTVPMLALPALHARLFLLVCCVPLKVCATWLLACSTACGISRDLPVHWQHAMLVYVRWRCVMTHNVCTAFMSRQLLHTGPGTACW